VITQTNEAPRAITLAGAWIDTRAVGRRVATVLRCGSCRFVALYFAPFYVALLASNVSGPLWVAFAWMHCFLTSIGTELLNRLSDEAEDRVNRPERTALCAEVGYETLRAIATRIWAVVAVVDAMALAVRPDPALALFVVLSMALPVAYSFGLRFKARRYLALAALTAVFGLPFLSGWAVGGVIMGERLPLLEVAPIVALMTFFIASLAGIKDITDVPGDERVGYRSLWVALVRIRRLTVVTAIVVSPYAVVIAGVAGRLLPPRFLWLLVLAPVGLGLALSSTANADRRQQQAVRELLYHFWFGLSGTVLFLFYPTAATAQTLAWATAYWLVASQYLHWSDGFRAWKVEAAGRLLWHALAPGGHP
jgi:4-hydroxybenzoate polyprenyltransferase